jgi:SnoaL-like domain
MQGKPDPATLADKMAIQEQIRSYCRAVDRLDIPLGHAVFHEDSTADYGASYYQGPGRGVIDLICQHHLGLVSHSHQVTNVLIEVTGDTAGSESYVYGTMRRDAGAEAGGGKQMQIGIWARYLDAWEKREGRWAVVQRMVVYDHEEVRDVTPMGQEIRSTRGPDDPSYGYLTHRKWGEPI